MCRQCRCPSGYKLYVAGPNRCACNKCRCPSNTIVVSSGGIRKSCSCYKCQGKCGTHHPTKGWPIRVKIGNKCKCVYGGLSFLAKSYSADVLRVPTGEWYTWNVMGCNMGEEPTTAGCAENSGGVSGFLSNVPIWAIIGVGAAALVLGMIKK